MTLSAPSPTPPEPDARGSCAGGPGADGLDAGELVDTGGLDAEVRLQLGDLALDVALSAAPGEVLAVLGPNGAGKTTLLRALAGLVPLGDGHVALNGTVLDDPQAGVRLTPQERAVGVMFQDYLLFPHFTATDNVAFGLRARGVPRPAARHIAAEWLDRVGLAEHVASKPGGLSGGQAQRVALARALAPDPQLLLLDEPLAALDIDTRRETRRELRRHLDAFTGPTVLITHEPLEAITLADRLTILEAGRVVQTAPPAEIARRPRSPWAARLVGLNWYRGVGHDHQIRLESGASLTVAERAAGAVFAVIHPRSVALHPDPPTGSPRNTWPGTVDALHLHDDHVRVHLDGPVPLVAQITPAALADLALTEGTTMWISVKASEIDHWPA